MIRLGRAQTFLIDLGQPRRFFLREVFDKFHVLAHANKGVDEVRRAEVRLGGAGVWAALRQSQWLWRKNPENLTESEAARLAKIDQNSLRTAKAYQMRLVLQDIYRSPTAPGAPSTTASSPPLLWK